MAATVFSCTGCAKCCRNLVDAASAGAPADAAALAAQGLYALPRLGGLQVWPWERRRMLARGAELGAALVFRPAIVVVAEAPAAAEAREAAPSTADAMASAGAAGGHMPLHLPAGTPVVLLWELVAAVCPLVAADDRCGVYDGRPVVCRAYPLLLRSGDVAVSALCPGAVFPAAPEATSLAYGPSARAAVAAGRYPGHVAGWLRFLEDAGRVRWARGLAPEAVAARVAEALAAGGPLPDVLDVLEREGAATQADVEAWCTTQGVVYA